MKQISVNSIIEKLGTQFLRVAGLNECYYVDNLADVAHVTPTTLDWVNKSKPNKQEIVKNSLARVILVDSSIEYVDGKVLIYVKDPKTALAIIGNELFLNRPNPGIHPTAIVDENAVIGKDVSIGPYCVIGKVKIGDDCIIESFVRIYDNVEMGRGCHVYDNAVLGGPGFGIQRDEDGNQFRFPQLGKLILGNYVDVGSHSSIDRGALSNTVIGDFTKIDSLCKIAHNTVIGKNVAITGHNGVAGSTVIEDDVWIGPSSAINNWCHIGKGAQIGIGSVVVLKVKAGAKVFGNPAKKMKID